MNDRDFQTAFETMVGHAQRIRQMEAQIRKMTETVTALEKRCRGYFVRPARVSAKVVARQKL